MTIEDVYKLRLKGLALVNQNNWEGVRVLMRATSAEQQIRATGQTPIIPPIPPIKLRLIYLPIDRTPVQSRPKPMPEAGQLFLF